MADNVRKQIRDAWKALVLPLKGTLSLRADPAWSNDPLQVLAALPSLLLYASDDTTIAVDNRGRTKQFHITNTFCLEKERVENRENTADEYTAEITKLVEGNIQLGGLANIVDQREVGFFLPELIKPVCVLLVTWRVEYRHALAQPELVY